MTRPRWDRLLSELCGGSSDPDAARLANEIEREVRAIETSEQALSRRVAQLEAALKLIGHQYANQDLSHFDYRVQAGRWAFDALDSDQ